MNDPAQVPAMDLALLLQVLGGRSNKHPPDWVVSFLSVKPCLVHCTSLFSNEWENACLLLIENA